MESAYKAESIARCYILSLVRLLDDEGFQGFIVGYCDACAAAALLQAESRLAQGMRRGDTEIGPCGTSALVLLCGQVAVAQDQDAEALLLYRQWAAAPSSLTASIRRVRIWISVTYPPGPTTVV